MAKEKDYQWQAVEVYPDCYAKIQDLANELCVPVSQAIENALIYFQENKGNLEVNRLAKWFSDYCFLKDIGASITQTGNRCPEMKKVNFRLTINTHGIFLKTWRESNLTKTVVFMRAVYMYWCSFPTNKIFAIEAQEKLAQIKRLLNI